MKSYWSVIAEIVGSGVVGDVERITALADLLTSRLERDGDEHATWIRRAITPPETTTYFSLASAPEGTDDRNGAPGGD